MYKPFLVYSTSHLAVLVPIVSKKVGRSLEPGLIQPPAFWITLLC